MNQGMKEVVMTEETLTGSVKHLYRVLCNPYSVYVSPVPHEPESKKLSAT